MLFGFLVIFVVFVVFAVAQHAGWLSTRWARMSNPYNFWKIMGGPGVYGNWVDDQEAELAASAGLAKAIETEIYNKPLEVIIKEAEDAAEKAWLAENDHILPKEEPEDVTVADAEKILEDGWFVPLHGWIDVTPINSAKRHYVWVGKGNPRIRERNDHA